MAHNLGHQLILLVLCLSFANFAQGGFPNVFLSELVPKPDGVELVKDDGTQGIISILENIPLVENAPLYAVQVNVDGAGALTVDDVLPGPLDRFTVEPINTTTWNLKLNTAMDRELQRSYNVRITHVGVSRTVVVEVGDANDNPVRITNDPDSLLRNPYDELIAHPQRITWIVAEDRDEMDQNLLTYKLQHVIGDNGNPDDPIFRINNAGELFIEKELDYKAASMHRLILTVYDSDEIHEDSVTITIEVKDIANEPPEFIRLPPSITVDENKAVGSLVETIFARDQDLGLNWPIAYSIVENHENPTTEKLFAIDPSSGRITVVSEIDAEMLYYLEETLIFDLSVTATEIRPPEGEGEELSVTEIISITIRDLDDRPPEVCTVQNPSQDPSVIDECADTQSYNIEIFESHTDPLPLGGWFVVRDLDPTFAYSQYEIGFAEGTDARIEAAIKIQPGPGSNITEYSLVVNTVQALDYDDPEPGFWYHNVGGVNVPRPHDFEIVITGKQDPTKTATAKFRLTVKDVNDNLPIFQEIDVNNEYEFHVCEETPDRTSLNLLTPLQGPTVMVCSAWDPTSTPIKVVATDADISTEFNSITYQWSVSSRTPPVEVDPIDGTMMINLDGGARNFDYELFPIEYFTIEAADGVGPDSRSSRATVKFSVLDENEAGNLDLRLPQSQVPVKEGIPNPDHEVLTGIIITSKDLDPDIRVRIKWDETKIYKSRKSEDDDDELIHFQNPDPIETVKLWFRFLVDDSSDPRSVNATLFLNDEIIDRELTDSGYERVDLVLAASDVNVDGNSEISQILVIRIEDINDNLPEWEDIGEDGVISRQIQETEAFPPEGDQSTDIQREIYTFRVRDRDLNSNFSFKIAATECMPEHCPEYLNLVTLTTADPNTGKAILSRTKGERIDREETKYFGTTTDILKYSVTVCDFAVEDVCEGNEDFVEILINVEDVNDNVPQWEEVHNEVDVPELADTGVIIATYEATDLDKEDKYGKITYVLAETADNSKFAIDGTSGVLSVLGPFEWSDKTEYTVTILAWDNYRPGITTDSYSNTTTTIIKIIDENNWAPEFNITEGAKLADIFETWPQVDQDLNETISVFDKDDPSLGNAQFDVTIVKITKDGTEMPTADFPFRAGTPRDGDRPGEKTIPITVLKNLTGMWADYHVTFRAVDKGPEPKTTERTCIITIVDENLNTPVFVYPLIDPLETVEIISLNSTLGPVYDWNDNLLPVCFATDADDDSSENSRVWYAAVEHSEDLDDGFPYFRVSELNGRIELRALLDHTKTLHYLYVKAEDRGDPPKWSVTRMKFLLSPDSNRPPRFNDTTPFDITLPENLIGIDKRLVQAFDPDPDIPGVEIDIHYHIVGGSTEYFEIQVRPIVEEGQTKLIPFIVTVEPLDREYIKNHQVVILASNDPNPPNEVTDPEDIPEGNDAYLLINIEVENEFDTVPSFPGAAEGGVISGGFSISNFPPNVIALIPVIDLDDDDVINFTLSRNFIASDPSLEGIQYPPFLLGTNELDPDKSINLLLNFPPQQNMRGFFTFNITATDRGLLSSTVQCKMYMIKDTNEVEFRFLNRVEEVQAKKSGLADALSTAFQYRCNIDRIQADGLGNSTLCITHFIDLYTNEPIPGSYIEEQQFNADVYIRLSEQLAGVGITLAKDGIGGAQETTDESSLLTWILVGGVGLMGVVLIVLSTTCYFNNRSLSRKVRALTATTFGSQMSGLNRTGAVLDMPNTNEFAIEGSNPMWTTNPGDGDRKTPAFDAESIGSGGSVLIGVEDDDDFKNYKGQENANPTAPEYDDYEDDDLYADPNSRNDNHSVSEAESRSDSNDDGSSSDAEIPDRDHDDNEPEFEVPPGFGNTSMRRNPLMDMAYEED